MVSLLLSLQLLSNPQFYSYAAPLAVQAEAAATNAMRQSAEYAELQQLRAFKAGFDAAQAQQQETLPAPPAQASLLAETCAKCHSGENPKGDLWLDNTVILQDDQITKVIRAMRTGHMPPSLADGERLDIVLVNDIEDELFGVEVIEE